MSHSKLEDKKKKQIQFYKLFGKKYKRKEYKLNLKVKQI